MKLVVGLGNPGPKYEHTRHNAGFLALNFILQKTPAISCSSKFHGQICEAHFTAARHPKGPVKVFFIKPQTFMNRSGEVLKSLSSFYKITPESDLLVIHDELDLKFGYLKPAFDSGPAGHNGVKNIIDELGTQKFHRLRIGVETRLSRLNQPTEDYVLSPFSQHELETLQTHIFPKIEEATLDFIFKT